MMSSTPPNDAESAVTAVRLRRIRAVVNIASGGVEAGAGPALEAILAAHGADVRVDSIKPEAVAQAVRDAVAEGPDLLVTLAGDGTARLAAELCGADGPLLAPLPGGTMNLLPHALYGARSWREAISSALEDGAARPVPGGVIDGHPFHVAALLGAPALWQPAREALRRGRLYVAFLHARRALSRAFTGRLRFTLDGAPREKAEALAVLSPLITRGATADAPLEAVALDPRHAADALRIGARSLFGEWRDDPAVKARFCRSATVSSRRRIPCLLDGELHRAGSEAQISFTPVAFRALVPARSQDALSSQTGAT